MKLVDINTQIKYAIYDDKEQRWLYICGSIEEFLNALCDTKNITIYNVDCDFLGNYETNC